MLSVLIFSSFDFYQFFQRHTSTTAWSCSKMGRITLTSSPMPEAQNHHWIPWQPHMAGRRSISSHPSPDDDDGDKPRSAKRARMHSDADLASLAHVSSCHFLYASLMGVLIQPVLCIVTPINVCHLRLFRPMSVLHLQPLPLSFQPFNVVERPIPFQSINDPLAEENEGCKPILAISRCYRSQHHVVR